MLLILMLMHCCNSHGNIVWAPFTTGIFFPPVLFSEEEHKSKFYSSLQSSQTIFGMSHIKKWLSKSVFSCLKVNRLQQVPTAIFRGVEWLLLYLSPAWLVETSVTCLRPWRVFNSSGQWKARSSQGEYLVSYISSTAVAVMNARTVGLQK